VAGGASARQPHGAGAASEPTACAEPANRCCASAMACGWRGRHARTAEPHLRLNLGLGQRRAASAAAAAADRRVHSAARVAALALQQLREAMAHQRGRGTERRVSDGAFVVQRSEVSVAVGGELGPLLVNNNSVVELHVVDRVRPRHCLSRTRQAKAATRSTAPLQQLRDRTHLPPSRATNKTATQSHRHRPHDH
jgi:hypothetical protein